MAAMRLRMTRTSLATLEELTAQLSGKSFNVIYAMESLKVSDR